jgi:transposase-like protein
MSEHTSELIALLGVVFFLLIGVLAWIGNRVHTRLDAMTETMGEKFDALHSVMSNIKDDLHSRITENERRMSDQFVIIDRRVSKIEARCSVIHGTDE